MKNLFVLLFLLKSFLVIAPVVEGSSCDVVSIQKWGSFPSQFKKNLKKPVGIVVVTHTVTRECDKNSDCEAIARAIRNTHQEQGYSDIRLSFLVGGNGKIYEGAGWKEGLHTAGYNHKSISLSFIGDFRDKLPTKKALDKAQKLLTCFRKNKDLASDYNLVGHRQLIATISPGDALQNHIQSWPHWTRDTSKL